MKTPIIEHLANAKKIVAISGVLCLIGSSGWSATIWSLSGDYSATENPNGAWSFGGKDRDGSGVPTGAFHVAGIPMSGGGYVGWNDTLNSSWKNISGGAMFGIAPGEVSISSDGLATSTMRWTAPLLGTIELTGYFGFGDYGVGHRAVFLNNVPLWPYAGLLSYAFDETVSVVPGDVLDFTVWDGGFGGNTPVEASIQYIPEPTPLMLLGVGGLIFCQRSRRLSKAIASVH